MSNVLLEVLMFLFSIALAGVFVFLEHAGMLKKIWVLDVIGTGSLICVAIAFGILFRNKYTTAIICGLLILGILWVIKQVPKRMSDITKPSITTSEQRQRLIEIREPYLSKIIEALTSVRANSERVVKEASRKKNMPLAHVVKQLSQDGKVVGIGGAIYPKLTELKKNDIPLKQAINDLNQLRQQIGDDLLDTNIQKYLEEIILADNVILYNLINKTSYTIHEIDESLIYYFRLISQRIELLRIGSDIK